MADGDVSVVCDEVDDAAVRYWYVVSGESGAEAWAVADDDVVAAVG